MNLWKCGVAQCWTPVNGSPKRDMHLHNTEEKFQIFSWFVRSCVGVQLQEYARWCPRNRSTPIGSLSWLTNGRYLHVCNPSNLWALGVLENFSWPCPSLRYADPPSPLQPIHQKLKKTHEPKNPFQNIAYISERLFFQTILRIINDHILKTKDRKNRKIDFPHLSCKFCHFWKIIFFQHFIHSAKK